MKNILSIIIPSYNSENTIQNCVLSILDKVDSKMNVEIVIVDNNSKDNTFNIERDFQKKYDFIKLYKESKTGVSNTRNTGIKNSNGKYIWFIDSDDEMTLSKDTLKKILELLSNHINYTVLFSYETVKNLQISQCVLKNETLTKRKFYKKFDDIFRKTEFNVLWNKIYSKKIIDDNNISFNDEYISGEDALFNYEYFSNIDTVVTKNDSAYKYYINSNQSKNFSYIRIKKIYENDLNRIREFKRFYKRNNIIVKGHVINNEIINCCIGEYNNIFKYTGNILEFLKLSSKYSIKDLVSIYTETRDVRSFSKKILAKFPLLAFIYFYLKEER